MALTETDTSYRLLMLMKHHPMSAAIIKNRPDNFFSLIVLFLNVWMEAFLVQNPVLLDFFVVQFSVAINLTIQIHPSLARNPELGQYYLMNFIANYERLLITFRTLRIMNAVCLS